MKRIGLILLACVLSSSAQDGAKTLEDFGNFLFGRKAETVPAPDPKNALEPAPNSQAVPFTQPESAPGGVPAPGVVLPSDAVPSTIPDAGKPDPLPYDLNRIVTIKNTQLKIGDLVTLHKDLVLPRFVYATGMTRPIRTSNFSAEWNRYQERLRNPPAAAPGVTPQVAPATTGVAPLAGGSRRFGGSSTSAGRTPQGGRTTRTLGRVGRIGGDATPNAVPAPVVRTAPVATTARVESVVPVTFLKGPRPEFEFRGDLTVLRGGRNAVVVGPDNVRIAVRSRTPLEVGKGKVSLMLRREAFMKSVPLPPMNNPEGEKIPVAIYDSYTVTLEEFLKWVGNGESFDGVVPFTPPQRSAIPAATPFANPYPAQIPGQNASGLNRRPSQFEQRRNDIGR